MSSQNRPTLSLLAGARATTLALALSSLSACGSSTSGSPNGSTPGTTASYAGTYAATYTGTFQNTSPNNESGSSTSTGTITVTAVSDTEVALTWQLPPNPPSGTAYIAMSGSEGTLLDAGTIVTSGTGSLSGGSCFQGLVNGNTQTNCGTTASIAFSGNGLTDATLGYYSGTTPAGVFYTGTYSGTWVGTKQ